MHMQAIVQRRYGTPDELQIESIARPTCGPDEVLVNVRAAGVDRGTWHLMRGEPYLLRLGFGFRGPKNPVPGLDLAGVVVATGSNTSRFRLGDEVFGTGKGSFAEFAVAKEIKLALKPSSLTFGQAAAVPVSGQTALQGLTEVGQLQAGQKVLITGASGGVGTFAVQIAKALGAEVTGVCSAAKTDLVRSLGADHTIDYTKEDFAAAGQHYDLILDLSGNSTLRRLRSTLTTRGTAVIAGGEEGGRWLGGNDRQLRAHLFSPFVKQRLTSLIGKEHYAILERLTTLIENGQVTPSIERTYPLNEAPTALRHLESGKARGKLVITLSPTSNGHKASPTSEGNQ